LKSWRSKGIIMQNETSSLEAWGWLAVCLICLCVVLYV